MRDHGNLSRIFTLIVLLLTCIILNSCRMSDTNSLREEDVIRQWLQQYPCASPCWQGITPGVTTREEARNLVRALPLVEGHNSLEISNAGDDGASELSWSLSEQGNQINYGGSVMFLRDEAGEHITELISLSQYGDLTISLKDITDVFGTPDKIYTFVGYTPSGNTYYSFVIFYLDEGLVIDSKVREYNENQESPPDIISQEESDFFILFVEPGEEGFKKSWSVLGNPALIDAATAWQGSWDFELYRYCRDGNCPLCQVQRCMVE